MLTSAPANPTGVGGPPSGTGGPGGRGRLVRQLFGVYPVQVMHALVDLQVPEALAEDEATLPELAISCRADQPALGRLLRAGCALGLVDRSETHYTLTADGRLLLPDEPGSIRNLVLLWGGEGGWRAWGELAGSVRSGKPAYDDVMGVSIFDRHASHPEEQRVFDQAMAESSRVAAPGVLTAMDVRLARTVVDVGGGSGSLLAALLSAHPDMTGVLFDRPTNARAADDVFAGAGIADRARFVGGDFFQQVPPGADLYLLKSVLHDWDDVRSVEILRVVRDAMRPESVLCVVEPVVPDTQSELSAATMTLISDLNMLVCTGGAERTISEYADLLGRAGLEVVDARSCPAPSNLSVVHVRPR